MALWVKASTLCWRARCSDHISSIRPVPLPAPRSCRFPLRRGRRQNRENLRAYVRKRRPELGLFYAERAWEQIAARSGLGALKMEADLAALADLVIIIVESPGTFAELGAFSLSDPLRKKLLPIVDEQYKHAQSFISTGPLAWIDQQSEFRPTIDVAFPHILDAVEQIEERINRIRKAPALRLSDLAASPKHLLFFLRDLLAVIQPATMEVIEYYAAQIAPSTLLSDISIPTLTGLAVATGSGTATKAPPRRHG